MHSTARHLCLSLRMYINPHLLHLFLPNPQDQLLPHINTTLFNEKHRFTPNMTIKTYPAIDWRDEKSARVAARRELIAEVYEQWDDFSLTSWRGRVGGKKWRKQRTLPVYEPGVYRD